MSSQEWQSSNEESSLYRLVRSAVSKCFLYGDRVCNRLFSSDFNPLYKSGTIAYLLLSVVIVTGFVLIFFYRLAEPYESILWMQQNKYGVGWLRALHRYASGAAVVAVVLHAFRMFAQKKSWGPRIFSWITGVLLLSFLFISGWTGYALVWDEHALALVSAGAKMIDSLGILADPISRSFNGVVSQPPPSFFFLNLFLHIVVPLALIFGTWVHTSRLARASWYPPKKLIVGIVGIYTVLALLLPAPLGPKADMLSVPNQFSADWFFSFFVPLSTTEPKVVFILWVVVFLFLMSLPFWLKPKVAKLVAAHNEEKRCLGCVQCVVDCPYEAIQMVPRTDDSALSKEVALVIDDLCVSCGLCAGSCGPMTIGVPEKKGSDHYALAKKFVAEAKKRFGESQKLNIVIGCTNQAECMETISFKIGKEKLSAVVFPSECMGTLHMGVVEYLAQHFDHLYLAACPERNCSNKDAHFLLKERLEGRREPHLLGRVSRDRIVLIPTGDGEEERVLRVLKNTSSEGPQARWRGVASVVLGFFFLLGLAQVSTMAMKLDTRGSILRLSWRLTGQIEKSCYQRTQEELAKLPAHMRVVEVCDKKMVSYRLIVKQNESSIHEGIVSAGGMHSDRPLYVDQDFKIESGTHVIEINFVPLSENKNLKSFSFKRSIQFREGKIALAYMTSDQEEILLKESL